VYALFSFLILTSSLSTRFPDSLEFLCKAASGGLLLFKAILANSGKASRQLIEGVKLKPQSSKAFSVKKNCAGLKGTVKNIE
jgi:hypothetical protein